jgi:hypothetical protein
MLLDSHNEYPSAFQDLGNALNPCDGCLYAIWLFNFDGLVEIVIGPDRDPEQVKILGEAVLARTQSYFAKAGLDKVGTMDMPTPYRIVRHCAFSRFDNGQPEPPRRRRQLSSLKGCASFLFRATLSADLYSETSSISVTSFWTFLQNCLF